MRISEGMPKEIREKIENDSTEEDAAIYFDSDGKIYVRSDSGNEFTIEPRKKRSRGPAKAAE